MNTVSYQPMEWLFKVKQEVRIQPFRMGWENKRWREAPPFSRQVIGDLGQSHFSGVGAKIRWQRHNSFKKFGNKEIKWHLVMKAGPREMSQTEDLEPVSSSLLPQSHWKTCSLNTSLKFSSKPTRPLLPSVACQALFASGQPPIPPPTPRLLPALLSKLHPVQLQDWSPRMPVTWGDSPPKELQWFLDLS